MRVLVAGDGAIFSSNKDCFQVGNALESLKLGFDISLAIISSDSINQDENLRDKVFVRVSICNHDENLSRFGIDSRRALKPFMKSFYFDKRVILRVQ